MKTLRFFAVAVMVSLLLGCAAASPVAQYALGAVDILNSAGAFKNSTSYSRDLVLGQEVEKYSVGNYEVALSDGQYLKNPSFIFMAYKDNRQIQSLSFNKKDSEDMKMFNAFLVLSPVDKKVFIKGIFIKYAKIDLGPVEEPEPPSEVAKKSPPSLKDIPATSFAPGRR